MIKFRDILQEEIKHSPRKRKVYYETIYKNFNNIQNFFIKFLNKLNSIDKEQLKLFIDNDIINNLSKYRNNLLMIDYFKILDTLTDSDKFVIFLNQLKVITKSFLKDEYSYSNYIQDINYCLSKIEECEKTLNSFKFYYHIIQIDDLEDFEYEFNYYLGNYDIGSDLLKDFVLFSKIYYKTLPELFNRLKNSISVEIYNYNKMSREGYSREDNFWTPSHDDVEYLYHASIKAKEIYKNGFEKNFVGTKNSGLGGSNNIETIDYRRIPNAISFTTDLYIAKEIARAFKDCWLIAHNKLTYNNLLELIEELPDRYKKIVYDRLQEIKNKNITEKILGGYIYYLKYSEKRYDPLFFGINHKDFIDTLKKIPYDNIGILKCKVDMTKEKQYLHSENEFRVQPSAILEISKLIQ